MCQVYPRRLRGSVLDSVDGMNVSVKDANPVLKTIRTAKGRTGILSHDSLHRRECRDD